MTVQPARLASEDVIINAPMSYAGSTQRIMRLRRHAPNPPALIAVTVLAVVLVLCAWVLVTSWYLLWGLWLVPYRFLRRGARKRKSEALRHRELLGAVGGVAPSAGVVAIEADAPAALPPAPVALQPASDVPDPVSRHTV